MNLTASVEAPDLGEVLTRLVSLTSEQAVRQALENLREAVSLQFLTEGAAYGQAWPDRKDHRDPGRPLLVASGRLLESYTDENSPEHLEEVTFPSGSPVGIFGSAVPYARFHEFGTRFLPARPVLTEALLEGAAVALF